MDLSQRKEQILSAVAEFYISVGEPVGSRYLAGALPFSVSPATIRNEMAELSAMGYLEQPHTSAGRVPSDLGMRYYAERLIKPVPPTQSEIFRLLSGVDHTQGDPRSILGDAAELISELTGLPAVFTTPFAPEAEIRGVQVVPAGAHAAMVLLTTSAGVLGSRIAHLPDGADYGTLELFYNAAAANFIGVRCADVDRAMLQTVALNLGERALSVAPMLTSLFDAVADSTEPGAVCRGARRLLQTPLRPDAGAIIELTADRKRLLRVLGGGEAAGRRDGMLLSIGRENAESCLRRASVVALPYKAGNAGGLLGVLGPTRMDYAHVTELLRYAAGVTGGMIAEATAETTKEQETMFYGKR